MTPAELLAKAEALLLDFDGPVCSVFSAIPAAVVADQLRAVLFAEPPAPIAHSADPFAVLAHVCELGTKTARQVNAALAAHEVEAVANAIPTRGSHQLIRQWHATGRPLAIVSNNSTVAINAYLNLHKLIHLVTFVSARTASNFDQLKPRPHFLTVAAKAIHVKVQGCIMVGDSTSDIEAAHAANMQVIAFANASNKHSAHIAARPAAVTATLIDLMPLSSR